MPNFSRDTLVEAAADLRPLAWLLCKHFYVARRWLRSRERALPRTREGGSNGTSSRIRELHSRYGGRRRSLCSWISVGIKSPAFTRDCLGSNWGCDKLLMVCFLLAVGRGTHASRATSATCFIETTPRTRSCITSENLR